MPNPKMMYLCKYCNKEYPNYKECEEHEKIHDVDFDGADTEEIATKLRALGEIADVEMYQVNNMIVGMPVKSFKSLMTEAAKRIEQNSK